MVRMVKVFFIETGKYRLFPDHLFQVVCPVLAPCGSFLKITQAGVNYIIKTKLTMNYRNFIEK
jgi:hypothetical protein